MGDSQESNADYEEVEPLEDPPVGFETYDKDYSSKFEEREEPQGDRDNTEERAPCRGRYEDRNMPTEHRLDCAVNHAQGDFGGMLFCGIICWSLVCVLGRKGLQVA